MWYPGHIKPNPRDVLLSQPHRALTWHALMVEANPSEVDFCFPSIISSTLVFVMHLYAMFYIRVALEIKKM